MKSERRHTAHAALIACALACLIPSLSSSADEPSALDQARAVLPQAPAGFDWVLYRNAAVLKPDGWNERTSPDEPATRTVGTFSMSPEPFSEKQFFEHGFSVQIVAGFRKLNDIEPSKGAILLLKPVAESRPKQNILLFDRKPMGSRMAFVLRYRDAPQGMTPIIVHKYLIAHDAEDTLHIFTYESPQASWDANWKAFGTPILGKVAILPFLAAAP